MHSIKMCPAAGAVEGCSPGSVLLQTENLCHPAQTSLLCVSRFSAGSPFGCGHLLLSTVGHTPALSRMDEIHDGRGAGSLGSTHKPHQTPSNIISCVIGGTRNNPTLTSHLTGVTAARGCYQPSALPLPCCLVLPTSHQLPLRP